MKVINSPQIPVSAELTTTGAPWSCLGTKWPRLGRVECPAPLSLVGDTTQTGLTLDLWSLTIRTKSFPTQIVLSSGGSLTLGKRRTGSSLADTNTEEDLTKTRSLLVSLCWPSLNNRVLDPKLCPSPNKRGCSPGAEGGGCGVSQMAESH